MKITHLKIENFLSVQKANLYLKDKGLVSIEGENLDKTGSDSNGAGKSSIINALLWCLYGSYGKDEAADDVVNSLAGKNCMVQVYVEDLMPFKEAMYRITRYRKHSEFKNKITVEQMWIPMAQGEASLGWRDITMTGKAIQEQINQIMGADETVFRAACFHQQENPIDIPAMSDKELKSLLEKVLPFEEFERGHAKAKEAVAEIKSKINTIKSDITATTNQITIDISDKEETCKLFKGYTKEVLHKDKEVDRLIAGKQKAIEVHRLSLCDFNAVNDEISSYEDAIRACGDSDIGSAAAEVRSLRDFIARKEHQITTLNDKCFTCGQPVDISVQQNALEREIADLNKSLKKTEEKHKQVSKNFLRASSLIVLREELLEKLAKHNSAEASISVLENECKLLQGHRLNPMDNPYQTSLDRLCERLSKSEARLKSLEVELNELQYELEILQAAELALSPKGVRYHLLECVAPKLTNDTNKYLQLLTDGAITAVWSTVSKTSSNEYKEKFSIKTYMDGRSKFGLLSGGEKRKVRLACFFALQDLIASRATKDIELWIGDEIDLALDEAGMERLMALLEEKSLKNSTILIISHNEMREWVPNTAKVTRKGGISSISGYLNA